MYASLRAEQYTYGDGFLHEMTKLGNCAHEIYYDVKSLQEKWAQENNIDVDFSLHWQLRVVLEQLKKLNPDVILLQGFHRITPKDILGAKADLPNLKHIFVHNGYPGVVEGFTNETIVLCGLPLIQKMFQAEGLKTHLFYHAFDARLAPQNNSAHKIHDFSFLGSSGYGHGKGHKVRYWELLKLAHNTPIKLWLDDQDGHFDGNLANNPFVDKPLRDHFYNGGDENWDIYPNPLAPLRYFVSKSQYNAPVYGLEYYQCLADSLVTFHRHGDTPEVGAMRMFQATGMGACLLTDTGSNMSDLFESDKEVITYSRLQECIDKANYLIENPAVALEIARNGRRRTLADHSMQKRYAELHQIISDHL